MFFIVNYIFILIGKKIKNGILIFLGNGMYNLIVWNVIYVVNIMFIYNFIYFFIIYYSLIIIFSEEYYK